MRRVWLVLVLGCGGGTTATPEPAPTPNAQPVPHAGSDKPQLVKIQVKRLAFEAFPAWVANNPDKQCPASLADLAALTTPSDAKDLWGTELKMFCGAELPAGATGVAIQSAGEDLKFDTADDVRSWD